MAGLREYDSREEVETSTSSNSVSDAMRSRGFCSCCLEDEVANQPTQSIVLSQFMKKCRRFLPMWYEKFQWITLCTKQKKVFCV